MSLVSQSAGTAAGGGSLGYLGSDRGGLWSEPAARSRLGSIVLHLSRHGRVWACVLLGAAAAAVVGYLVAQNPRAAPAHVAVSLRVAIIAVFVAAGAGTQLIRGRERMGVLLMAAGAYASVWLLNGSSRPILFSIGMLFAGLGPAVFAYLALAYPSGRLHSRGERSLLLGLGGAVFVLWVLLVLTSAQPPLKTPLLNCAPHCPHNSLFVGSGDPQLASAARTGLWVGLTALASATPLLLSSRLRTGAEPLRRSFVPLEVAAIANAVLWVAFVATRLGGSESSTALGAAYIETAVALTLGILAGLFVERLSMGRALANFVRGLGEHPGARPEVLLARALKDPSVEIAYFRPRTGTYVDASGLTLPTPAGDAQRAVARVERNGAPVAAVSYDAALCDQAAFVEAAGAVAVMHDEAKRLEEDLTDVNEQLTASRLRLVEAADNERQRIERDLHDGVQQQVVGLRLRLDLAAEVVREDPKRGEQMLSAIGRQLDDVLSALRDFAAGIYPSVLTERGLKTALESAVRTGPRPVYVQTFGLKRYPEDVEVSVYFCCLEAIQNIVKHAGCAAEARVRVWHIGETLAFDVRDTGAGFDPSQSPPGSGLVNMRDRVEAIGGRLWVGSQPGKGTWVRGRVPLGPQLS